MGRGPWLMVMRSGAMGQRWMLKRQSSFMATSHMRVHATHAPWAWRTATRDGPIAIRDATSDGRLHVSTRCTENLQLHSYEYMSMYMS